MKDYSGVFKTTESYKKEAEGSKSIVEVMTMDSGCWSDARNKSGAKECRWSWKGEKGKEAHTPLRRYQPCCHFDFNLVTIR